MLYYKKIAYYDFTMEKYKVQKDKSILSILSESIRGSKNVREELEVFKGQLCSQREPTILHHDSHGKWWKLKSPWELKISSKVKTEKDWEDHQFFIKSDIISDENWNLQENWRCCQRYNHQIIWRTTNFLFSQTWQMVEINITRIEEALKGQLSKDIKKWHDITHINNIMQGGVSKSSVKPCRNQKHEKVPKYRILWKETLEAKPWQAKKGLLVSWSLLLCVLSFKSLTQSESLQEYIRKLLIWHQNMLMEFYHFY